MAVALGHPTPIGRRAARFYHDMTWCLFRQKPRERPTIQPTAFDEPPLTIRNPDLKDRH
jgi:hypothetical protein